MLVGALLAVIGVVAGLMLLGNDDNPEAGASPAPSASTSASPTPSPSSSAPASPSTVRVAAEGYVGRPVEEVRAELEALGLQVAIEPVTTADVPEGTVTTVDPTGEVPLDGTVTVGYAVAPVPEPQDEGDGEGEGDDGQRQRGQRQRQRRQPGERQRQEGRLTPPAVAGSGC